MNSMLLPEIAVGGQQSYLIRGGRQEHGYALRPLSLSPELAASGGDALEMIQPLVAR